MTWLLAADDASEEELQELAAEQRLLAHGQRVSMSGTTRIPGKDEPWSWLRLLLHIYLTTGVVAVMLALLAIGIPVLTGLALLLATALHWRKQTRLLLRATGLPGTEAVAREMAWQERHGRERNTVIG